jgi:ribonuclease BN (tRNA processing enzyme)
MLFTFLGTGCPVPSPVRAGPAHCVSVGDALVLIDCGSGVAQRLVAAGRRGADVDALIVTHYHSDHVADFWTLVVSSWHQGRTRPWQVYAPPAAIRHFEAQVAAYADEIALRVTHERRSSTAGLEIAFHELASRGSSERSSPDHTSVSKTCLSASAWVPVAVKWGSIDSGPERTPMVSVWANAAVETVSIKAAASAAPTVAWWFMGWIPSR